MGRNNNGVEQNKIRAYGEQQLVRVIPVIKKHQSKRTQDNVRSISKGGNENRMQQIRTRPPQEEETSNDDRKKRTKNRKSNQKGDIITSIFTNETGYVIVHKHNHVDTTTCPQYVSIIQYYTNTIYV